MQTLKVTEVYFLIDLSFDTTIFLSSNELLKADSITEINLETNILLDFLEKWPATTRLTPLVDLFHMTKRSTRSYHSEMRYQMIVDGSNWACQLFNNERNVAQLIVSVCSSNQVMSGPWPVQCPARVPPRSCIVASRAQRDPFASHFRYNGRKSSTALLSEPPDYSSP